MNNQEKKRFKKGEGAEMQRWRRKAIRGFKGFKEIRVIKDAPKAKGNEVFKKIRDSAKK